jgi:superfamily II DNA/RNA helicase
MVAYMTTYHKNIGSTGKSKVVYRYLPREVGELLVYYLWFVLPFWKKIESLVSTRPIKTASAYIWEPEREKEWEMPQRKRQRLRKGSQSWNIRERLIEEVQEDASLHQDEYASELWNSNRVTQAIQKASLKHMGMKLNISTWRHSNKAIIRIYISNKTAVKALMWADEDDESNNEDEPFDLQANHTSKVAGAIYGRLNTESLFSSEAKRAEFRQASIKWHQFLQMPSALKTGFERGIAVAADHKEAREEQYRRWKMMQVVNIDQELKRLVGEEAEFRDKQKLALQVIMQQKSPIVAIMGTGSGKSLLFMLPASVSSGITIVVVPLLSLRGNIKE